MALSVPPPLHSSLEIKRPRQEFPVGQTWLISQCRGWGEEVSALLSTSGELRALPPSDPLNLGSLPKQKVLLSLLSRQNSARCPLCSITRISHFRNFFFMQPYALQSSSYEQVYTYLFLSRCCMMKFLINTSQNMICLDLLDSPKKAQL